MEKLKAKSNKLHYFLYTLARDYLTTGQIEEIMVKHVEAINQTDIIYSNGYLANYAIDLAERLTDPDRKNAFVFSLSK